MIKWLIPDLFVKSIYKIDFARLQRRGIKAIIVDLDNTLVEAERKDATPELLEWLAQLRAMGFRIIIVSNNNKTRVSLFARPLNIPFIHRARKPLHGAFRHALARLETSAQETAIVGDQLFTDVLGGNRAGLFTILVSPVSERGEGFFTRINRRMEKFAFSWMDKKGIKRWED